MPRVIIIRPEPGCSATVDAARLRGLAAEAFPLFAIAPRDWSMPAARPDCLLAGSANAFRYGGETLGQLSGIPVHAVGEATAEAARQAGFTVAAVGTGGLQSVLGAIPAGSRVLRLAGEDRVELTVPGGVTMDERVVYASAPCPMPADLAAGLATGGTLVLLHSGLAASHLRAECQRLGLPLAAIAIAALAPRIAEMAGPGWLRCEVASEPRDEALLALADQLCQSMAKTRG